MNFKGRFILGITLTIKKSQIKFVRTLANIKRKSYFIGLFVLFLQYL